MAQRNSSRTDVNRTAILAHIGSQGPVSRADLARGLGVSPALVTQLTKQLIADGLLRELDHTPSQGGRPARLIGLVSDAGHAIGVKLVADHVTFVEVGIDGGVSRSATEPYQADSPTALAALTELLRRFIAGGADRRVLGIGIGVPGSVDQQGQGTVDSSQLGWHQVPLGRTLRRELDLPVLVDNNVNALTMAEKLHGQGRGYDNLLVITIGTGIGAGLVADGSVMRGATGSAGHIGHIPIDENGPLCQCGNRGCLESLVGQNALVEQAKAAGVIPSGSGIAALKDEANAGNTAAAAIFSRAGHVLGRALAGIVHTVDPEIIILLGEGTDAWRHWSYGFEPAFRSALMPHLRGVTVAVETWQDDSWAQGAASLVLATPFDSDGLSGEQGRLVRERLVDQSGALDRP
jgi:predicted NBD/HSP70 family sugar kinase